MGTWGRRRLSTRRSEEKDTRFKFYIFGKLVSDEHVCVSAWFTLYVWQVFLVLVHFAAVDGESQAFKQHGSLLQFGISVGKQAQRAALGDCNPGWREAKVEQV